MKYEYEVEYTTYYVGAIEASSYEEAFETVCEMAGNGFSPFQIRDGYISNIAIVER